MGYRAFFSYARADDRVASWLHRQLDSYRTPKALIGSQGALGPVPAKLHPIFRDRTDLQAGGHVDRSLQQALEASDSLVVLCTPTSAKSFWVNHECETFLSLGRADRIFPVIAAGEPNSGDPDIECFPPALRGRGLLAADLREIKRPSGQIIGDGRDGGRLKLIAGLLGVPLNALVQRERRRQRRLVAGLGLSAVVFAATAVAAAGFAWLAQIREGEAVSRAALLSGDAAATLAANGDVDGALLLLLDAAKAFKAVDMPERLLIAFDEVLVRAHGETRRPAAPGAMYFGADAGVLRIDEGQTGIQYLSENADFRTVGMASTPPLFAMQATNGDLIALLEDFRIERVRDGQARIVGQWTRPDDMSGLQHSEWPSASAIYVAADGALIFEQFDKLQAYFPWSDQTHALPSEHDAYPPYSGIENGAPTIAIGSLENFERLCLGDTGFLESINSEVSIADEYGAEAIGLARLLRCNRSPHASIVRAHILPARNPYIIDFACWREFGGKVCEQIALWEGLDQNFVAGPLRGGYENNSNSFAGATFGLTSTGSVMGVLVSGRDVVVFGRYADGGRREWRFPDDIVFAHILPGNRLFVAMRNEYRILDLDITQAYSANTVDDLDPEPLSFETSPSIGGAGEISFDGSAVFLNGELVYRGANDVIEAVYHGPTGRVAIVEVTQGDDMSGVTIYSTRARRVWRRTFEMYRWYGEVDFDGHQLTIQGRNGTHQLDLHTPHKALGAAKAALSSHCRNFSADNYDRSRCWPAATLTAEEADLGPG